jgi:hypothetical protein
MERKKACSKDQAAGTRKSWDNGWKNLPHKDGAQWPQFPPEENMELQLTGCIPKRRSVCSTLGREAFVPQDGEKGDEESAVCGCIRGVGFVVGAFLRGTDRALGAGRDQSERFRRRHLWPGQRIRQRHGRRPVPADSGQQAYIDSVIDQAGPGGGDAWAYHFDRTNGYGVSTHNSSVVPATNEFRFVVPFKTD